MVCLSRLNWPKMLQNSNGHTEQRTRIDLSTVPEPDSEEKLEMDIEIKPTENVNKNELNNSRV